jgi:hypothetical protein
MTFLSEKNKDLLTSTKMNMSMDIWIVWKRQKDSHLEDEHEHGHLDCLEEAERQPSCRKSIDDEVGFRRPDRDFGQPEHDIDYIGNCPSANCPNDPTFKPDDKNHCKFDTSMDKSS